MPIFQGYITALATPFQEGAVDWAAFESLIERQIAAGVHGLVPCGTTGESPTLSHQEHKDIVEHCVRRVKGRVPVIAGTGSNATAEALDFTRHAKESGADAALIVTPYYNKPTQEGLYQHFKFLAQSVDIPIIIYNIPGRCVIDMTVVTMARLAAVCPNIIGVKDATGDLSRVRRIASECGEDFCQLSGEDHLVYSYLAQGGHGAISVTSNVVPGLCMRMFEAWKGGDGDEAAGVHERLMPLHEALFTETSPQPVKYALSALGLCRDEMRLPLVPASEAARAAVDGALASAVPVTERAA